jgi:hypothetical protein
MISSANFEREALDNTHDLLLPGISADAVATVRKGMTLVVGVFLAIFLYAALSTLSNAQHDGWNPPGSGAQAIPQWGGDCSGTVYDRGGTKLGTYRQDAIWNGDQVTPAWHVRVTGYDYDVSERWIQVTNQFGSTRSIKQMVGVLKFTFTPKWPGTTRGFYPVSKTSKCYLHFN